MPAQCRRGRLFTFYINRATYALNLSEFVCFQNYSVVKTLLWRSNQACHTENCVMGAPLILIEGNAGLDPGARDIQRAVMSAIGMMQGARGIFMTRADSPELGVLEYFTH